jgi:hypothetical protein
MLAAVMRCVCRHANARTMCIRVANVRRICFTTSMFYSVLLTITAVAIIFELYVRQLAVRILFEGVGQRDAV